jgi:acetyltransferase-like isoleucine patch superfamily enzyme
VPDKSRTVPSRGAVALRIAWTIASLVVVQTTVCGLSAVPVVIFWVHLIRITADHSAARVVLTSLAIAPSYVLFALCLMTVSPLAVRLLHWQPPPDAELPIASMDWPLLGWVRSGASTHLVRLVAGSLFRGTPIWTAHLRFCGARLGRRVYVNSLSVSDYNLVECGDDVVIGAGVHLSGHTVEAGVVKTARVRIGDRVTIGLSSVVEIGAEIGSDVQVGALSFVPKYARLEAGHVYVGTPVRPLRATVRRASEPPGEPL